MENGKPKVLCVDDRAGNLHVRAMLLDQFGCETLTAEDYTSTMRVLEQNDIDILVIDYHLANERTGDEIALDARVLRPKLPIVMLSGDPKLPERVYESVDAVLVKGFSGPRTLLDIIQRLLPAACLRAPRPMMIQEPFRKAS